MKNSDPAVLNSRSWMMRAREDWIRIISIERGDATSEEELLRRKGV